MIYGRQSISQNLGKWSNRFRLKCFTLLGKQKMQDELENYDDLRELRKAKADPKNQNGRPFDVVAAELGLIKKKA